MGKPNRSKVARRIEKAARFAGFDRRFGHTSHRKSSSWNRSGGWCKRFRVTLLERK